MRSRVLALVAAIGMVVVASNVRARIDEGADGGPRVVCATEAAAACTALEGSARVEVEAAGDTAAKLIEARGTAPLDAWIVPAPWPELVRAARQRAAVPPTLGTDDRLLARSNVVIGVWPDRAAALEKACGSVSWACIVRAAGAPAWTALGGESGWGVPKIALADPRREGVGPAVLGSAAAALAPDDPLGDAVRGGFAALARAMPRPLPSLDTVLAGGPALADAYVTVEALAQNGRLRLIYPSPVVTADMVLTTVTQDIPAAVADRARDALGRAGWRAPAGAPLDATVVEGLQVVWGEVGR